MGINIQEIIHFVPVFKSLFIILRIDWGWEGGERKDMVFTDKMRAVHLL